MIEELYATMQRSPYFFSVDKLWQAYSVKFSEKIKSLFFVGKGYKEKTMKPLDFRALLHSSN